MGCLSSKLQETTEGDGTMKGPMHAAAAATAAAAEPPQQSEAVQPVADKREEALYHVSSGVQDWSERSDDLKSHILRCSPSDKRTESYIASLADLAKRSFQKREYFGDPGVIKSLLAALKDGQPPVAKASAHALRLLSFCHPNHTCVPPYCPLIQCLVHTKSFVTAAHTLFT
jgi:hypothetical protein